MYRLILLVLIAFVACGAPSEEDPTPSSPTPYDPYVWDGDKDYWPEAKDCDDAEWYTHPNAPEMCDGVDNDCNGKVDDDVDELEWFPDRDNDNFGNANDPTYDKNKPVFSCKDMYHKGGEWSVQVGDCDDANIEIYPGALEIEGNGIDENCDRIAD